MKILFGYLGKALMTTIIRKKININFYISYFFVRMFWWRLVSLGIIPDEYNFFNELKFQQNPFIFDIDLTKQIQIYFFCIIN